MKMCKIARPSQQQQSFCYAFAGDCSPKAYSTEFFRVVIRGYVRLCVCLSVSLSLNLYNREGTYFNEFIIIPYYLVHMTFARSRVKGQATEARQRRPRKSCELDRFRTAEEISTKTFTNTSFTQATNWLRLQVKVTDNIFQKCTFPVQACRLKHRHKEMQIC